jgi:hypothetical protein
MPWVVPRAPAVRTGEVTGEVSRLINVLIGEMKRTELREVLEQKHQDHFREAYLIPALKSGLVEMTVPSKPKSRVQKYRLTAKGHVWLAAQQKSGSA